MQSDISWPFFFYFFDRESRLMLYSVYKGLVSLGHEKVTQALHALILSGMYVAIPIEPKPELDTGREEEHI